MATVTITVAAAQIGAVRAAFLTLYQLEADALEHACEAYLRDRESLALVDARRAALRELDAVLDAIGWQLGERESEPISIVARAEVALDAVYAALLEGIEQLDVLTRELHSGGTAPAALRAVALSVISLIDLLNDIRVQGPSLAR